MIGLIIDRRGVFDEAMPLDTSCSISQKLGREGIPSIVVSDNSVDKNAVVTRMAHEHTGCLYHESARTIIECLGPAWSLQDRQMIYAAADPVRIHDANESDATLIRVSRDEDGEADQTIANISEILDVVALEYTASLLEVRYLLMGLAWNANPYVPVAEETSP